jgi:hypothetical protein
LRKTLRIWLAAGVAFAFVFEARNEPWLWNAVAFATLEWLVTLAVVFALAAYVHGVPRWVSLSLYAARVLVFYAGPVPYIAPVYPVLKSLPAGWIDLVVAAFHGRPSEWFALLILMAFAVGGLWALMIRFRGQVVVDHAPEESCESIPQTPRSVLFEASTQRAIHRRATS